MERMTAGIVEVYLRDDWVGAAVSGESGLVVDRWLRESVAKRAVFAALYGDILRSGGGRRVLDVGGGVSALTPRLGRSCFYVLSDILAHGGREELRGFEAALGRPILLEGDWHATLRGGEGYDVIVANDLFPNSDQRLELFLERALPLAGEVRLSLTFYNRPRFYLCRRVDGDELLWLLGWTGRQTGRALERFAERIVAPDFSALEGDEGSLYGNGRQIALATLRGDRHV
jgi:hypothetical protein